MRSSAAFLLVSSMLGCATPGEQRAAPADPSALDWALEEVSQREVRRPADDRQPSAALQERWQVRRITTPDPLTESLGTRTKMDVRFYEAELEEALRLLAEAGGFAFVAEGELSGRVTTELRNVRPYDALVVIAQAHGARVTRRGTVLVVTPGAR